MQYMGGLTVANNLRSNVTSISEFSLDGVGCSIRFRDVEALVTFLQMMLMKIILVQEWRVQFVEWSGFKFSTSWNEGLAEVID